MIPKRYQYLYDIVPPRMVSIGLGLYGIREIIGPKHNPVIMSWAKELGLSQIFTSDEIAWCGLAHAAVAQRAEYSVVKDPLWAKNWVAFGKAVKVPMLGDTLVFTRPGGGGHVGTYIAESGTTYHVLGGNQGDAFCIIEMSKTRLIAARRPNFKIGQPSSVKQFFVKSNGIISSNEA